MAVEGHVIAVLKNEDFEAHLARHKDSRKLIVVDFTASWCPPCRIIAPIFEELAKTHTSAIFLKVDVDELKDCAQKFDITAMPTFVFIRQGAEISRTVGANKMELMNKVKEFINASVPATSTA